MEFSNRNKRKLGDLLVDAKVISEEGLKKALLSKKIENKSLVKH